MDITFDEHIVTVWQQQWSPCVKIAVQILLPEIGFAVTAMLLSMQGVHNPR